MEQTASTGYFVKMYKVYLRKLEAPEILKDLGITNGINYCYRIESIGSYAIDQIEEPILNFSHKGFVPSLLTTKLHAYRFST